MGNEIFWIATTAIASWALVIVTIVMINRQLRRGRSDLQMRQQTYFEDKFDSVTLINERKKLANQLLSGSPHADIKEPVMDFFESVGIMLRKGYLEKELVWAGFSYFTYRWWSTCKDYITKERELKKNDKTIFEDFQYLVDELYEFECKKRLMSRAELEPSVSELQDFLNEEKNM